MQHKYNEPLPLEKIISALSYFTMGIVGFVWLILGAILKLGLRPFLRYHIYQSIFLSFLFFILSTGLTLIFGLLSYIPFIGGLISTITFLIATPLFGTLSILNILFVLFIGYLVLTSALGKYSYIPWVSNIIKANVNY